MPTIYGKWQFSLKPDILYGDGHEIDEGTYDSNGFTFGFMAIYKNRGIVYSQLDGSEPNFISYNGTTWLDDQFRIVDFGNTGVYITDTFARWAGENNLVKIYEDYIVQFNATGGTFVSGEDLLNITVKEDSTLGVVETPVQVGYRFLNWSTSANENIPYDFSNPVKNNFSLYAVWQLEYYVVMWNNEIKGTSEIDTATPGGTLSPREIPIEPGYIVLGWSTSPTVFNEFNFNTKIEQSYNLFAFYLPLNIELVPFNNAGEINRVDKSSYLSPYIPGRFKGIFRDSVDLMRPQIIIETMITPLFNYMFIPIFMRYYFVNKITNISTNTWLIDLKIDVLYTYKDTIKQNFALIERQENNYNKELVDSLVEMENKREYELINPMEKIDGENMNQFTFNTTSDGIVRTVLITV